MELLKTLAEIVKDLPDQALYVLIIYFLYKLIIVGSWIAVARLAIIKLHNFLTREKKVQYKWRAINFTSGTERLLEKQIFRLLNRKHYHTYEFLHESDIEILEKLIDQHLKENK